MISRLHWLARKHSIFLLNCSIICEIVKKATFFANESLKESQMRVMEFPGYVYRYSYHCSVFGKSCTVNLQLQSRHATLKRRDLDVVTMSKR